MALIVAKFGGTSVASPERIQNVAKRLIAIKQAGNDVVAVVSAMGKTTDELMGLSRALNANPPARELDRLLSTGEQVSMALLAMEKTGFSKEETALIGDRLYTDIACGVNAGINSIFVLSGEGTLEDLEASETKPDFVYPHIKDVLADIK